MARRDEVGPGRDGGVPQRLVAGEARARREVGAGGDGDRRHREGHAERPGDRAREVELGGRARAQAVIDAVRHHRVPDLLAQEGERVQERGRVRPARAGAEHDVAAAEEALVADEALHAAHERGGVRARAHQASKALQKTT